MACIGIIVGIITIVCLLHALPTTNAAPHGKGDVSTGDKKLICYYSSWSGYRPSVGAFTIDDIPIHLCTHIVYAFIGLNNRTWELLVLDPTNDITKGGYRRFTSLKKRNSHLKTLISVGGWVEGGQKYSEMVSKPERRKIFVNSVVDFLKWFNFDGLDLDWEFPGSADRHGKAEDKENFVQLVKELRDAFDKEGWGWTLTAVVPIMRFRVEGGYDVPKLASMLDHINLLTYDLRGNWTGFTDVHAPLRAREFDHGDYEGVNMNDGAQLWERLGAPTEKLTIGLPLYGRTYTLADVGLNGLHSQLNTHRTAGSPGPYTKANGTLAYYEICELFKSGGWEQKYDNLGESPYMVKGDQWIGYDDRHSLIEKVKFAQEKGLGGVTVWSVDLDDFRGVCGESRILLHSIYKQLTGKSPLALPQPGSLGTTHFVPATRPISTTEPSFVRLQTDVPPHQPPQELDQSNGFISVIPNRPSTATASHSLQFTTENIQDTTQQDQTESQTPSSLSIPDEQLTSVVHQNHFRSTVAPVFRIEVFEPSQPSSTSSSDTIPPVFRIDVFEKSTEPTFVSDRITSSVPPSLQSREPPSILSREPPSLLSREPPSVFSREPPSVPPSVLSREPPSVPPSVVSEEPPSVVSEEPPRVLFEELPSVPPSVLSRESPSVFSREPPTESQNQPSSVVTREPPTESQNQPSSVVTREPPRVLSEEPLSVPPSVLSREPPSVFSREPPTESQNQPSSVVTREPPRVLSEEPPSVPPREPPSVFSREPPTESQNQPSSVVTREPPSVTFSTFSHQQTHPDELRGFVPREFTETPEEFSSTERNTFPPPETTPSILHLRDPITRKDSDHLTFTTNPLLIDNTEAQSFNIHSFERENGLTTNPPTPRNKEQVIDIEGRPTPATHLQIESMTEEHTPPPEAFNFQKINVQRLQEPTIPSDVQLPTSSPRPQFTSDIREVIGTSPEHFSDLTDISLPSSDQSTSRPEVDITLPISSDSGLGLEVSDIRSSPSTEQTTTTRSRVEITAPVSSDSGLGLEVSDVRSLPTTEQDTTISSTAEITIPVSSESGLGVEVLDVHQNSPEIVPETPETNGHNETEHENIKNISTTVGAEATEAATTTTTTIRPRRRKVIPQKGRITRPLRTRTEKSTVPTTPSQPDVTVETRLQNKTRSQRITRPSRRKSFRRKTTTTISSVDTEEIKVDGSASQEETSTSRTTSNNRRPVRPASSSSVNSTTKESKFDRLPSRRPFRRRFRTRTTTPVTSTTVTKPTRTQTTEIQEDNDPENISETEEKTSKNTQRPLRKVQLKIEKNLTVTDSQEELPLTRNVGSRATGRNMDNIPSSGNRFDLPIVSSERDNSARDSSVQSANVDEVFLKFAPQASASGIVEYVNVKSRREANFIEEVDPSAVPECGDGETYSVHQLCEKYWWCIHGRATLNQCEMGLLWNPETNSCDWADSVQRDDCQ